MNIQPHMGLVLDQLMWSAIAAGLGIGAGVVLGIVIGVHLAAGRAVRQAPAPSSTAQAAPVLIRETIREVIREVPAGLDGPGRAAGTSPISRTRADQLTYAAPAGQLTSGGVR